MSDNSLVLHLNLMEWNRGYLVFKNGENAKASARIKGFYNALEFIAEFVQLQKAIETGAGQNGHFVFSNQDENKNWLLHYHFVQGVVNLVLMLQNLNVDRIFRHVFLWEGSDREFSAGVNRMEARRESYRHWWKRWF